MDHLTNVEQREAICEWAARRGRAVMTERLSEQELVELVRVAQVATPGPWQNYPTGSYVHAPTSKICQLADPWIANRNQEADAAHIAAFNPETVQRLLGEIAALRQQVQAQGRVIERLKVWMGEYPDDKYTGTWWRQELDRLLKTEGLS